MQPLLDQGYHLYVDNWYTSIVLAEYFLQRGTMICGTLRKDRKGIPKTFANYARLKKGESIFQSANGMLLVKLLDTKAVHFLSTIHRASLLATNKRDRCGRPGEEAGCSARLQPLDGRRWSQRWNAHVLHCRLKNHQVVQEDCDTRWRRGS